MAIDKWWLDPTEGVASHLSSCPFNVVGVAGERTAPNREEEYDQVVTEAMAKMRMRRLALGWD